MHFPSFSEIDEAGNLIISDVFVHVKVKTQIYFSLIEGINFQSFSFWEPFLAYRVQNVSFGLAWIIGYYISLFSFYFFLFFDAYINCSDGHRGYLRHDSTQSHWLINILYP